MNTRNIENIQTRVGDLIEEIIKEYNKEIEDLENEIDNLQDVISDKDSEIIDLELRIKELERDDQIVM